MSEETDKNKNTTSEDGKGKVIKVEVALTEEIKKLMNEKRDLETALAASKTTSDKEKTDAGVEKKRIEDELADKKATLEQIYLEKFEADKQGILKAVKESSLKPEQIKEIEEKIQTPAQLESVKGIIALLLSGIKPMKEEKGDKEEDKGKQPPVAGKAIIGFTPPTDAETFESKVAMIDELYNRAFYKSKEYTVEQVTDAKKKIDTLFQSLINSKSWTQMKQGKTLEIPQLLACPRCGATVIGEIPEKCPKCNFKFGKLGDVIDKR